MAIPWNESEDKETDQHHAVLLTGGTGYVAGRLIPLLEKKDVMLRCLTRNPDKLRQNVAASTEVVPGDVLDSASLQGAMRGIHTAYYLVHLMSDSKDFAKDDRQSAMNFAQAARRANVQRLIYLGGATFSRSIEPMPRLRIAVVRRRSTSQFGLGYLVIR